MPASLKTELAAVGAAKESLEREHELFVVASHQAEQAALVAPASPDGSDGVGVEVAEAHLGAFQQAADAVAQLRSTSSTLSLDGADAALRVDWLCRLLVGVTTAVREAPMTADDPLWEAVEALAAEGQGLAAGAQSGEALFPFPAGQLALVRAELALRAKVDAVVRKLAEAVEAVDDQPMAALLEQAHALGLDQPQQVEGEVDIPALVAQGDWLLPRIAATRAALSAATGSVVEQQQLYDALARQAECGWGETEGMVGHPQQYRALCHQHYRLPATRPARYNSRRHPK
jgi:hypothetical protein